MGDKAGRLSDIHAAGRVVPVSARGCPPRKIRAAAMASPGRWRAGTIRDDETATAIFTDQDSALRGSQLGSAGPVGPRPDQHLGIAVIVVAARTCRYSRANGPYRPRSRPARQGWAAVPAGRRLSSSGRGGRVVAVLNNDVGERPGSTSFKTVMRARRRRSRRRL